MKHSNLQKISANSLLFTFFLGLILVPVATLGIVNKDSPANTTQVLSAQDYNDGTLNKEEYEKIILNLKQELRMCRETQNPNSQ